jgi:hypothetical protein
MEVTNNNSTSNGLEVKDVWSSKEASDEDRRVNKLSPFKFLLIRLKEAIAKAGSDTTGHGIPRILENKNIVLRLAWLMAVLLSVGGCAYLIYGNTTNFFSWSVVTTIKEIGETPSLFPVYNSNLLIFFT